MTVRYSQAVRQRSLWLLAMGIALYFFANFQRSSIPGTIFNELQMDFRSSAAAVAAIGAIFMYVYAFVQLLVGVLVDKYGGARTIAVGCGLFCVGSILFPMSNSMNMLYLSRMLVGMGAGTVYLSLVKEVDRLFPDRFASVLGLVIFLGYSGGIVGALPLSKVVGWIGWRWGFMIAGGLTVLCYAGYLNFFRGLKKPRIVPGRLSLSPLLVTIRSRASLFMLLSAGSSFGVYYMMLTVVGKKFLEDYCHASPTLASGCLSLMVVVSALVNMLSGTLTGWGGNRRRPFFLAMMLISLVGAVLGLLGMRWGSGSGYFIMVMLLFAISSGFSPITNSLIRELNPKESTGAAVCALNFAAYVAVAVCGNLAGMLMDVFSTGNIETETSVIYPASSYSAVFVLAFVVAASSLAASLLVPETHGRNVYGKVR